jgi:hypothetical protein
MFLFAGACSLSSVQAFAVAKKSCLDDAVFKNCSITKLVLKLWFYKLKRHKTVVISGVSKTP